MSPPMMHDRAARSLGIRPRFRSAAPAVAIAAALLLVACGSDDPTLTEVTETEATETVADPTTTPEPTGTTATTPPSSSPDASPSGEDEGQVTMESIQFMPDEITVEAGTTVTWDNQDSVAHTVTARGGDASFESGDMPAGATFETTLDEPGTYEYVCDYHVGSGMTGTIIVE